MEKGIQYGSNSKITSKSIESGNNITIGNNVLIEGAKITIEDNVHIMDNATIKAETIHLGYGSIISENCKILMPGKSEIIVGDHFFLGEMSKILVPIFKAGDYCRIHNHSLVNGENSVIMGHNIYMGQNGILNANRQISIGNNVGLGIYSSIWTHGFFGELLEGCNIHKVAPVIIEDDVWILGAYNVIFPGVHIGKKSIIMTGSIVIKDVPANSTVSGNPAINITDKLVPYRDVTVDEKYAMMKDFINDFIYRYYSDSASVQESGWNIDSDGKIYTIKFSEIHDKIIEYDSNHTIIITKNNILKSYQKNITIFDLSTKAYNKTRAEIEIKLIKFLVSTKARFIPLVHR